MPQQRTFTIEYTGSKGGGSMKIVASEPITALNEFHRTMQRKLGVAHADYRVTRCHHDYKDAAGKWVESNFDLPNTPTPDVTKPWRKGKDSRKHSRP